MLETITSTIQGLTPLYSGAINVEICSATLDGVILLEDEAILDAQKRLVAAGETVEPGGSAAAAVVFADRLPARLCAGRNAADPLRVAIVVSGGNPDPAQIAGVRRDLAAQAAGRAR